MKKIELEAMDFVDAKKKQFSQGLKEAVNNLES